VHLVSLAKRRSLAVAPTSKPPRTTIYAHAAAYRTRLGGHRTCPRYTIANYIADLELHGPGAEVYCLTTHNGPVRCVPVQFQVCDVVSDRITRASAVTA
jgi:hypothetical protein